MLIVAATLYLEVQRRQALARIASALGLQFTSRQHGLPAALDGVGFYLFTQGPPLIQHRMEGACGGYRMSLFDFSFPAEKGEEGSRDPLVADVGQVENRMQTVA